MFCPTSLLRFGRSGPWLLSFNPFRCLGDILVGPSPSMPVLSLTPVKLVEPPCVQDYLGLRSRSAHSRRLWDVFGKLCGWRTPSCVYPPSPRDITGHAYAYWNPIRECAPPPPSRRSPVGFLGRLLNRARLCSRVLSSCHTPGSRIFVYRPLDRKLPACRMCVLCVCVYLCVCV